VYATDRFDELANSGSLSLSFDAVADRTTSARKSGRLGMDLGMLAAKATAAAPIVAPTKRRAGQGRFCRAES
jgi:hypothetical protein